MIITLPNIPIHAFKVGDKVRVIKKIERWSYGINNSNSWVDRMDLYLGKQFIIGPIGPTGCRLHNDDSNVGRAYTFAFESLCKYLPNEQLLLFDLV